MVEIDRRLGRQGDVVGQAHDEILVIGDASDPESIDQLMADFMNLAPAWLHDLPIDSEGSWAATYGDCK